LQHDRTPLRADDLPALVGDSGKLRAATGWTPERSVDSIIEDLIRASTD
jgi:UDP-glucose 4-epimerase